MDALTLLLAVLAVYRLAHLLALETGPFELCERWRGWAVATSGYRGWVAEGVGCPLCISFWLALPAAAAVGAGVLGWFGIAGAVLVLHKVVYRESPAA